MQQPVLPQSGQAWSNQPQTFQAGMPTMQQPHGAAQVWMTPPRIPANCPPGLEYLTQVDQVLCHQQIDLLEMMTGWDTCNRYAIKNSMGQQIYFAFEESDACMRQTCGTSRGFELHVVDNANKEIMKVWRPFVCCAGCCWCACCCNFEITVEAPPGTVIGTVKQVCAPCTLQLDVKDASGNVTMHIGGECKCCICCSDIEFPTDRKRLVEVTTTTTGEKIGCVTKQWAGYVQESYTNADKFGISFPLDLDVRMKATLIGATFLIDFVQFEQQKKRH